MSIHHIEDLKLPVVSYKKGEVIIEEGVKSSKILIMQSGEVKVVSKGEEICKITTKGAVFGETSVMLNAPTTAKVEVTTDATFFLVEDAENYLKTQPELVYNIAIILASRLVNMNLLFVEMRGEIGQKGLAKIKNKLYSLMITTNKFFDRDVMKPFQSADQESTK